MRQKDVNSYHCPGSADNIFFCWWKLHLKCWIEITFKRKDAFQFYHWVVVFSILTISVITFFRRSDLFKMHSSIDQNCLQHETVIYPYTAILGILFFFFRCKLSILELWLNHFMVGFFTQKYWNISCMQFCCCIYSAQITLIKFKDLHWVTSYTIQNKR